MRRNNKKKIIMILRFIVLFFAGLVVAGYVALSKIDIESLRGNLISVISDTAGMPIEINGDVKWRFGLRPQIVMRNITVKNAVWAKNSNGIKIDKMYVSLDLFSLLFNKPSIRKIRLVNAKVFLEQNTAGEYSLSPIKKNPEPVVNNQTVKNLKYPFDLDAGFSNLELDNPSVSIILPSYRYDWAPDKFKIEYQDYEYSGYLSKRDKVYPFIIKFSKLNDERKVYPIRAAFANNGKAVVANIALESTSKLPIDFIIKGDIDNLQEMLSNFDIAIPEIGNININISGGMGHKKITLHKSSVSVGDSDLEVSGVYDWSEKIPVVSGNIKSKNFVLKNVFTKLYGAEKPKWIRPNRPLNVFQDIDISNILPKNMNINLDIALDKLVVYRDLTISDSKLKLKITPTNSDVDVRAKIADGDVHTRVLIDTNNFDNKLNLRVAGIGERIYAGQIFNEIRIDDVLSELPTNFEFYFQSRASDLTGLMKNLNGPFRFYSIGRGYAHTDLVEYFYGQDFLTQLRHTAMNMFTKKKKYDTVGIDCAEINLKIRNGRIDTQRGIAIESKAVNMRAAGYVDLGAEKLKASFVTTPVRGIKLSVTGNVINSTEFQGNLAEPDIKINGNTIAAKAISATGIGILIAPFTGGISLFAGAGIGFFAGDLLENWLADEHPCKTARVDGAPAKDGDPQWLNRPMAELIMSILN